MQERGTVKAYEGKVRGQLGEREGKRCGNNYTQTHEVPRWDFLFLKSAHKHKHTHLFYHLLNQENPQWAVNTLTPCPMKLPLLS